MIDRLASHMRWLLLAHNLPPDPGSCSKDFGILAGELIRQGHEVVFAGGPVEAEGEPPHGVERHLLPSWPKSNPGPLEKLARQVGELTALRRNWLAAGGIARDVAALAARLKPDVVLCNHSAALMAAVGALEGRTAVWMKGTMNLTPGGSWRRRVSSFRRGWERRALGRFGVAAFQWGPCPPREEIGGAVEARGGRAVDLLPGPQPDELAGEAPRRQGGERLGIGFLGTRAPSLPGAVGLLAAGLASVPGLGARVAVHLAGPGSGGESVIPGMLESVEGLEWTDRRERLEGGEVEGFVRAHPVGLSPGNAKAPNATGKVLRLLAEGRGVLAFGLPGFADAALAARAGCGPAWEERPGAAEVGRVVAGWADKWEAGEPLVAPDWGFVRGLCIDRQVAGLVAAVAE